MNISPHLLIDAVILSAALTITLVLRAKGNAARKEKEMITKEEEKEFKKPKLYKFWNFLIYGSSVAIGVFLVYLYSAYILYFYK
jgi:hypothetical protein